MNKSFFCRSFSWPKCSSFLAACVLLPFSVFAQPSAAPLRSADFVVAVVNSEPITNQEVQALSLRLQRDARAQGLGTTVSEIKKLALEQLINDKVQIQQAASLGVVVDEAAINQAELSVANNNQMTVEVMRSRIQQDGLSIKTFRDQLRQQLLLTRVREREVDNRIRISDSEINQFLSEQIQRQAAKTTSELNLAMILIGVPENSSPEQIKVLEDRAQSVLTRARNGEDFASLAAAFSTSPDRGANGGAMGLRALDRYPELFVQATSALPVGGVSNLVRSGAGFHILKVLQRQSPPSTLLVTQTRARHILLRPSAQLSQAQAMEQLGSVRRDILSGRADFAEVARRISQDGSAAQGGDLGWASPGMFVPEFEQTMNQLRPGQLADPLVSRFGVHLIEVTDRRDAPMTDAEQRNLARNALREGKLEEAYASWVQDIRGKAFIEMRESPQ
ncbi:peptidylprolyl isomerase [Limnohabitans sp.]|uniref:peptidylprolyl isomerase n=1 Tax=Limnohabitans sp. TaxID=1907725 RepID=UPI0033416D5F